MSAQGIATGRRSQSWLAARAEKLNLKYSQFVAVDDRAGGGHCHRPAEPELVGHQGSEFELDRDSQTMCIVAILKFFSLLLNN